MPGQRAGRQKGKGSAFVSILRRCEMKSLINRYLVIYLSDNQNQGKDFQSKGGSTMFPPQPGKRLRITVRTEVG